MPCTGGCASPAVPPSDNALREALSERRAAEARFSELKAKYDQVTRLLCRIMKMNDDTRNPIEVTPELRDWWQDHKALDAKRLAREKKAQQKAIAAAEKELQRVRAEVAAQEKKLRKLRQR